MTYLGFICFQEDFLEQAIIDVGSLLVELLHEYFELILVAIVGLFHIHIFHYGIYHLSDLIPLLSGLKPRKLWAGLRLVGLLGEVSQSFLPFVEGLLVELDSEDRDSLCDSDISIVVEV